MAEAEKAAGTAPRDLEGSAPLEFSNDANAARILGRRFDHLEGGIEAFRSASEKIGGLSEAVGTLKDDVRNARNGSSTRFFWLLGVFGAGFLILAGLVLSLHGRIEDRLTRQDDKIGAASDKLTRIETKLEDLLARIPPAITPAPRRSGQ